MAEAAAAPASRAARAVLALDRAAGRRWFLPAVGAFPLADYALPFLPNQILLVALSSLRPRLWWRLAFVFALAAGLGAFAVAALAGAAGPALIARLGGGAADGSAADALAAVRAHGLWALAAIALLPPTPRTAVVVCAVAGLPPAGIAAAVATARLVPATLLAAAGSAAPRALRRLRAVDAVMREVEAAGPRR